MAKIDNQDHSLRRGKLNKKDNEIHRVRNGKEHVYSIHDEYEGPASEAKRQGAKTIRLHAQVPAVPFYERFGFHPVGEPFLEADIPHILMELTF